MAKVSISVTPTQVHLGPKAQQQFHALVQGAKNSQVDWSIQTDQAGGSIDSEGLYTAPDVGGKKDTVVATAHADKNATAIATVTVLTLTEKKK